MASVTLRGIDKRFGDTRALADVSLDIADGELAVFVGPSGCGKSTLLRAIAGLESIDAGSIRIGETDVADMAPSDRDVAMVFQSYALYPHMTVRENMEFGMKVNGVEARERERRVTEAARVLQLDALLDRKPAQLSGGQRQRVAIGRAIVRQPKVFLFDEPLSNLDARLRVQMRVELEALHRELGSTMIHVTHDQVEAMTMADRIVVLNDGVVEQVGRPLELYRRPRTEFVASFLGSPEMNFLDVDDEAGSIRHRGRRIATGTSDARAARLGIRPEHVEIVDGSADAGSAEADGIDSVSVVVRVKESLGGEAYLYTRHADTGEEIVVKTDGEDPYEPGDRIELRFAPERVHLFGADRVALERSAPERPAA